MTRICDRSECPANALHDVVLHGQDFHFCGHHWAELEPVLRAERSPWDRPRSGRVDAPSSTSRSARLRPGRRRSPVGDR